MKLEQINNQRKKIPMRRVIRSDGHEALIRSGTARRGNQVMDRRTYRIGSEGIEAEAGAAGDQRRSGEVYGEMGG
jgi:hypothetical protein